MIPAISAVFVSQAEEGEQKMLFFPLPWVHRCLVVTVFLARWYESCRRPHLCVVHLPLLTTYKSHHVKHCSCVITLTPDIDLFIL